MSALLQAESLAGRVALVTGASRGIGAAIAATLADAGATVIGTATSSNGAAAIGETLAGQGRGAVLDIASEESVLALMKELKENEADQCLLQDHLIFYLE